METESQEVIADTSTENTAEQNAKEDLSLTGFTESLMQPEEETPENKAADEEAEQTGPDESEADTTEKTNEFPDLESLSDEQREELATFYNSRAIERYGELSRRAKDAEEKLATLQSAEKDPLKEESDPKTNPYSDLETLEDVKSRYRDVGQMIEVLEEAIEDADGLMPDDTLTVDGEDYTKKQVRKLLKDARKARESFLPQRARELQQADEMKAFRGKLEDEAKKMMPWIEAEEESEAKSLYNAWMQDPEVVALHKTSPKLSANAPLLLALAAEGLAARKAGKKETIQKGVTVPNPKPPQNLKTSAAVSDKEDVATSSKIGELTKRFEKGGGKKSDFEALLAAT